MRWWLWFDRQVVTLNEVPGKESRQCEEACGRADGPHPSMKCREKNPGNICRFLRVIKMCKPSMKCREKNPGNFGVQTL